jgi:hypothetical protein
VQDQFALDVRVSVLQAFEVVAAAATDVDEEDSFVVVLLRALHETFLDGIGAFVHPPGPSHRPRRHHAAEAPPHLRRTEEVVEKILALAVVGVLEGPVSAVGWALVAVLFEELGRPDVDGEKVILAVEISLAVLCLCGGQERMEGGFQDFAQEANGVLHGWTGETVCQRRGAVGVDVDFSDGAHCREMLHHTCWPA